MEDTAMTLERARAEKNAKLKVSRYLNPKRPGDPHWWQNVQTLHIIARKTHLVADLTGLGKTVEVLNAYAILKEKYPNLKLWVLGSKSSTVTWEEEIPRWTVNLKYVRTPSEKVSLSLLPKAERVKWRGLSSTAFRDAYAYSPWKDHGDILITNYEQAQRDWKVIVAGLKKEDLMVVGDEAAHYSHEDTDLYAQMVQIRAHADRYYPLTATPAKNNLFEARAILSTMDPTVCPPEVFRQFFCTFRLQRVKNPKNGRYFNIQVFDGHKNEGEFRKMIEPWYLGYRDDDPDIAKHLPELMNKIVWVELTPEMERTYRAIEERIIDPEWNVEMTSLTKLLYAQMFVNSPGLIQDKFPSIRVEMEKCVKQTVPKLRELIDILTNEMAGEKTVIYSHWERTVTLIYEALKARGFKVGRITGKEEDEERKKARDDLVTGEIQHLVIDDAGGESLNMQSAKAVIMYDLPWSPGDYAQVVGRVRRLKGGEQKLVYHLMVKDSIDAYKWEVLDRKFSILERLYKGRGGMLKVEGVGDEVVKDTTAAVLSEMRKRSLNGRK